MQITISTANTRTGPIMLGSPIARKNVGFKNIKPSVCIDAVLGDYSIEAALQIVAGAKMPAFEFWAWWEKDLSLLNEVRQRFDLDVAACCTQFISLVEPQLREPYLEGLQRSIEAAQTLQCSTLISQVGDRIDGVFRDDQRASVVAGLQLAAPMLESTNVTLLIEPLNEKVDHPGYFLTRSQEAFDIVRQVNSPNVKVVFDIYHQQISEGNLIPNILDNLDQIGHFHAAGQPGRHELTHGEIHYPEIFKAIEKAGYQGYVGLEYWPENDPATGLAEISGWFAG